MPIVIQIGDRTFFERFKQDHPGLQLWQALEDMADFIHDTAVAKAPGSTKAAIDTQIEQVGSRNPQIAVGLKRFPRHAVFVHEGTGVFGDRRRPIIARPGQVFAFKVHGRSVFARMTLGQHPQPFLRDAVRLAESTYIPLRVIELGHEIT